MRDLIRLCEAELKTSDTLGKSFNSIGLDDVVRATIDVPDLASDMYNWWKAYLTDAGAGAEMPTSSKLLTTEQWQILRKEMGPQFERARQTFGAYARRPSIAVKRHVPHLDLARPLGSHWSIASFGNLSTSEFGDTVLMGSVASKDVDWAATIAHAFFFDHQEREITVRPGATIRLKRIDFLDGQPATT